MQLRETVAIDQLNFVLNELFPSCSSLTRSWNDSNPTIVSPCRG